jgi:hypothetical protein
MLLTIAFLCFIAQVVAWLLLPASGAERAEPAEAAPPLEVTDATAA